MNACRPWSLVRRPPASRLSKSRKAAAIGARTVSLFRDGKVNRPVSRKVSISPFQKQIVISKQGERSLVIRSIYLVFLICCIEKSFGSKFLNSFESDLLYSFNFLLLLIGFLFFFFFLYELCYYIFFVGKDINLIGNILT